MFHASSPTAVTPWPELSSRKTKSTEFVRTHMSECAEEGCEREAAVLLRIPWDANRTVCTDHARSLAQQDGVVAEPLEGVEWP